MDDTGNINAPQPGPNELQSPYDSIRNLVVSIMVLLIVVSGTLWIFLRWQVKYTTLELEGYRVGATNFIAQYEKVTRPAMDGFIAKLAEYGRTHPDFAPIMTKYGIKSPGPVANVTPASAPPASAPAKKK